MNRQSLVFLLKGDKAVVLPEKVRCNRNFQDPYKRFCLCFLRCIVHFGVHPRATSSTTVTTDEDEELGVGGCRYRGKAKYNNLNDIKKALVPHPCLLFVYPRVRCSLFLGVMHDLLLSSFSITLMDWIWLILAATLYFILFYPLSLWITPPIHWNVVYIKILLPH